MASKPRCRSTSLTLLMKAVAMLPLLLLTACSGTPPAAPATVTTTPPVTTPSTGLSVPDTLRSLQASGALPTLDTSTTVAGPDTNSNGVRDDLDKFIAALPDTAAQQKALTQFAQAVQTMMTVDLTSPSAVSAASVANNRAVGCIWQTYPSGQHKKVLLVQELSVNTLTRLQAYEKYNAARNGAVIPSLAGSTCN
jgi:delta 1-pyrroline-5-carboxylate dehydrogenase